MRVARSAPDHIEIRGRDATRTPLLLGVSLALAVTLALIATRETASSFQTAAWSVIGLIGLLTVFLGWPRVRRIDFKRGEAVIRIGGAAEPMPIAETKLRLSAVRAEGVAGDTDYGVVLERTGRAGLVLLSGARPDRVLRDLALVRSVVPVGASPGWGLPGESPWIGSDAGEQSTPPRDWTQPPTSGRTKKSIAGTILVGSAGVSAIIVRDVWVRMSLGDTPSALSLTLPILFVSILVAIGFGILTSRSSLTLGADLVFTRHVFGLVLERQSLPRNSIRAGYLVSPDGASPRHLLLDTDGGPAAFQCSPADGPPLLTALYGGGAEISSAPPTQSRE